MNKLLLLTAPVAVGAMILAGGAAVGAAPKPPSPDTSPPTVTSVTPTDNSTGVDVGTAPTATFSEPVQVASITVTYVITSANTVVPFTVSYNSTSNTATLTPNVAMAYSTKYTLSVKAKDLAGNNMKAPTSWSFTTGAAPPPPPVDDPPVAELTASPTTGDAPLPVHLDASGSTDGDATPVGSYSFDYGDGSAASGPQAGSSVDHTYTTPGNYTAMVTVTDTAGKTATNSVQLTVSTAAPPPDNPPVAALSLTPSSGTMPLVVTADASASTDNDASGIATYAFDFGDGTMVAAQPGSSVEHTYTAAGTYQARVTVTDSAGKASTATATATVNAPAIRPLDNDCSAGSVEFTFDDGPGPYTPQVLQTLSDLGIHATFFVLGNRIDGVPSGQQAIRDEVAQGHVVGNHTYDHASITGASTGTAHLSDQQITDEIQNTTTAIVNAGVPAPTLYRPPYGDIDAYSDNLIRSLGDRIVMSWQLQANQGTRIVDSEDWTGLSSAQIASNVENGYLANGWFHPGITANAVLAFHDGNDTAPATIAALQPIVDWMNTNHYCATTTMPADTTGGVVPTPAPPEPTTGNLVQNPSLETLHVSGGVTTDIPECFQRAGNSTGSNLATWTTFDDPSQAHSGNRAEQVSITQWTGGDRKLVLDQQASHASCIAPLSAGQSVRTWIWYKGSWVGYGGPTDQTKVSIAVYYRDSSGAWVYWVGSPLVPPSSGWNLASYATPALPAGATGVSFGLAIQGVGTLLTDDYAMTVQ